MISLDPQTIELIAQRTAELVRAPAVQQTPVVLTRAEAKAYVKRRSEGAFCEWCQRWQVRAAFRGRYSRSHLDVALQREARARG